jgi:hypothetical protein
MALAFCLSISIIVIEKHAKLMLVNECSVLYPSNKPNSPTVLSLLWRRMNVKNGTVALFPLCFRECAGLKV